MESEALKHYRYLMDVLKKIQSDNMGKPSHKEDDFRNMMDYHWHQLSAKEMELLQEEYREQKKQKI